MPPSVVQQFGNMLTSRWPLKKDASPSPKPKAIHEVASYPRVTVTPENDSCLNPSMSHEHILACGHIITTLRSDEPCAPNCYHIANNSSSRNKEAPKRSNKLDFYCDACVETGNEALVPGDLSSTEAENRRLKMRQREAELRGKNTKFRKCYIALKATSLPCNSDGTVKGRYTPRKIHHPFDTTIPQVGDNFFEDVLTSPTEEHNPTSDSGASAPASIIRGSTDVNSSPANLGEGGRNYLRFTQSVAQETGNAAPQTSEAVPNTASETPSRPAAMKLSIKLNANTTRPGPAQQRRKRPTAADEDDDYVDLTEEEPEVFERPAKRPRKSASTTPTVPTVKRKPGRPLKSATSTPVRPATKPKTGRPTGKRS